MLTIAYVRNGTKYPVEYENALRRGIDRTLRAEHRFLPIYDGDGWWAKLRLFDPSLDAPPVLYYFDLDTVFLRDLDDLIGAMDDAGKPIVGLRGYGQPDLGSAIMRIDRTSEACRLVWERWARVGRNGGGHGDQGLIWLAAMPHIGFFPDELAPSYKVLTGKFPRRSHKNPGSVEEARVLVFHGSPMVHEVAAGASFPLHDLVRNNWK